MKRTILEKGTMKKGPEGLSASGKECAYLLWRENATTRKRRIDRYTDPLMLAALGLGHNTQRSLASGHLIPLMQLLFDAKQG